MFFQRPDPERFRAIAFRARVLAANDEGRALRDAPGHLRAEGLEAVLRLVTGHRGERAGQHHHLAGERELRRERWSLTLRFEFLEAIPAELVVYNPMGLLITYLQADRALVTGEEGR